MTAADFTLEQLTDAYVRVVHAEGHRYTFAVVALPYGNRGLSEGISFVENPAGRHSARYFQDVAFEFAWAKARAAGIVG